MRSAIRKSLLAVGIGHVVINLPLCFAILLRADERAAGADRARGPRPGRRRVAGAAAGHRAAAVAGPVRRLLPRLHPVLGRVHHRLPAHPLRRHPAGRDLERLAHRPQPGDQRRGLAGVRRLDRAGAGWSSWCCCAGRASHERIARAARDRAALRRHHRAGRHRPRRAGRRLRRAARALGQRQDHAALDPGRLPGPERGRGADRRCRRHRRAAGAAPDRDRVPGLRPVPAPFGRRQCRLRSGDARRAAAPSAAPRWRRRWPWSASPASRARRIHRALRRPAAARGAGAGTGRRARGPAARRALGRPRRGAAPPGPGRAQGACSAGSARPSSTSPTTRRRRWRWPTCSWS